MGPVTTVYTGVVYYCNKVSGIQYVNTSQNRIFVAEGRESQQKKADSTAVKTNLHVLHVPG